MAEEWRDVPGWAPYRVSSEGRLMGRRGLVAGSIDRDGYTRTCLRGDVRERKWSTTMHAVVALAFHGERPAGHDIDHINGRRGDNRAENLRYVSHAENMGGVERPAGERNSRARLTAADVAHIRSHSRPLTQSLVDALAEQYGIHPQTVRDVYSGRKWPKPNANDRTQPLEST